MIRNIQPDDIATVTEIYNYYVSNTIISFEESPISSRNMKDRIDVVLTAGFPWLVAEENSQIVGYAYANQWNSRIAYKRTAEVSVYLSHLFMSKGIGSKLYSTLFTKLKNMSVHIAIGGISLPNPASIAIHEKFGMHKVAHFEEVGYKYGKWIDVGYWQVELEEQLTSTN